MEKATSTKIIRQELKDNKENSKTKKLELSDEEINDDLAVEVNMSMGGGRDMSKMLENIQKMKIGKRRRSAHYSKGLKLNSYK